jgi:putative phage-type endonuclease
MKTFHFQQYSPEWWALRTGIPTASEFDRIITPAKGTYAEAAGKYMDQILSHALGWSQPFGGNEHTERGNTLEPKALKWLRMRHDIATEPVGFILSECGTYGASPDALVKGTRIPVEVKSPDLHTFIGWKREIKKTGEIPREHKAQVHGEMFVCESDHAYFIGYCDHPCVERIMMKVERSAFTDKLGPYLKQFTEELRELESDVLGEYVTEYRDGLAKKRQAAMTLTPDPA